jgi:hypothetical protein
LGPPLTYGLIEEDGPAARAPTAAMRVQVNDETYLGDLIAFLENAGYRSQRVRSNEILVAPNPGSKRLEELRLDLDLLLRAWEVAHPDASARQSPDREPGDDPNSLRAL